MDDFVDDFDIIFSACIENGKRCVYLRGYKEVNKDEGWHRVECESCFKCKRYSANNFEDSFKIRDLYGGKNE